MNVDVWSDIVCPFCYIGKRRFEQALDRFEHKQDVTLAFKSFQLDPNAEKNSGKTMHDILSAKYQMSLEQARQTTNNVAAQAKEVGLDYDFDAMVPTNTADAHRLSHYAKQEGKVDALMEKIMHAFFTEGKNIGDHETLESLAEDAGLDKQEASRILKGDAYAGEVRSDQEQKPLTVLNQKNNTNCDDGSCNI
ncbi:DsbA family oxidoreductase [Bacillus sp. H-16]|uniref:DsbA family oxidoreductase n=1 Tax=Alteribacter salitolerans TaxID=2912333 RepID=UPI001963983F|nr:DsbA family oxidoreductase [Alteribacter salitolerans]MBM7095432.1 DsbA family oxidoreductase [Alteribacter salitolerans]